MVGANDEHSARVGRDPTTNGIDMERVSEAMDRFARSAEMTASEAGERMASAGRNMQIARLEGELAEAKRRCAAVVIAAQNALGERLTLDEHEIAAADDHEVVFHRVPAAHEVIVAAYREKPNGRAIDPVNPEPIFDFDRYEDVDDIDPADPF